MSDLGLLFDTPFYESEQGTNSTEVPFTFPVALNGRGFLMDLELYERQTVDLLREQADTSNEPGEHSLSPAGLWRRSTSNWNHGAGQDHLDREDESDRQSYRSSKGIDPWTAGEISLLPATANRLSSAASNLDLVALSTRLYVLDGQNIKYTTDPTATTPTWVTVTGTPAVTPTSMTTDGNQVWVAYGASGIWVTTRSTSSASQLGTELADVLAYANGRLLASRTVTLKEIKSDGTAVTLRTHPNADFVWSAIAGGTRAIYAAGFSGDQGELYRITINEASTDLSALTSAASLPDGEFVRSIFSYIGAVVLGTNRGVRLATSDGAGNLDYGPLIETPGPVLSLEPQERFVWFGWSRYDSISSGLGRIDLSVFTEPLLPAYASDLMAAGQGDTRSVVTWGGRRYFSLAGAGVYGETLDKVSQGTIDSGLIQWGTTERKITHSVDVRHRPLNGSVTVSVAVDEEDFEAISTAALEGSTGPESVYSTREMQGEQAEVRLVLNRAATTTLGPIVTRWTLQALISPVRSELILAPLILASAVGEDTYTRREPLEDWRYIKFLERQGTRVTYQEGEELLICTVVRCAFKPSSYLDGNLWFNGTALVTLQTVD